MRHTPADFILVFRTLLNHLDCIIVLNCYSNCSGHALAYFFLLTFFPFPCIIRNKKWVCYRTAIAQAGCSFLFIDFLLLRGYNYSQEMGFLLSKVLRLEKVARFFFYVHKRHQSHDAFSFLRSILFLAFSLSHGTPLLPPESAPGTEAQTAQTTVPRAC